MRQYSPYSPRSQPHVPEVYHHTEQRGNNPNDKMNVTTYVFHTNKNGSQPRGHFSRSNSQHLRSVTPQPSSTYYTEEVSQSDQPKLQFDSDECKFSV